jgi:hypothetical protein
MMKNLLRIALVLGLIAVAVAAVLSQRGAADRLRREIVAVEKNNREGERLRTENQRLTEFLEQRKRGDPGPVPPAELERAHQEVAMWERRGEELQRMKAAGDIGANRDPERGMVRIEHFRNVGRATPAAAFQTTIWAATQADFDEVGKSMALNASGRAKAQAILDKQSAESRARFDSPEKLIGVVFAHQFTKMEGFQIVGSTDAPDGQVAVTARHLANGVIQSSEMKIPFQRGPDGWQMVVPDDAIDAIPDYLLGISMEIQPPDKK